MLKSILFWLLVSALVVVTIGEPMTGILPMGLVAYRFRARLITLCNRFSLPIAFIMSGLIFGLLTEIFAIYSNINLPYEKRILLSPYPHIDLILAFFWYGLFIVAWYIACTRYHYTKLEIFFIAGLYGLLLEQKGTYLSKLFGPEFLLPIFIMCVYAVFPILAYVCTQHRFMKQKTALWYVRYPVAVALLVTHVVIWHILGLVYYPILQNLGYLGYLNLP